ncbi:MAG: four-carbon acid sugar kinase family protein [Hyphomicrobiaceae bacterium]
MPLLLGAIADDLTGGIELASMLVAQGVRTGFGIGPAASLVEDAEAQVIALKTRVIPADEAVTAVLGGAERLITRGARQVFFKYCATFDSTPAGNIGPCAEALIDRLDAHRALFCPALCETGRTVYQGHMFGGSTLLSDSPKRFDPLTPMTDSNLVRVLQAQSRQKVGLIDHSIVEAGPEAIRYRSEQLAAEGATLQIVDTLNENHLAAIADAAAGMPLLTGNSSVAAHLPACWRRSGDLQATAPIMLAGVDGPGAVIAGSVAEQTRQQLAVFGTHHPVLTLHLERAFAGDDLVGEAMTFARQCMRQCRDFAISTAVPQAAVDQLQTRFGRAETAAQAEFILSTLAHRFVHELGVRRIVVAGGETSGAVVAALGLTRLEVGPYLGLGMSRAITRTEPILGLSLKSGKLGSLDVFERLLADMCRPLHAAPMPDVWPSR